MKSQGKKKAKTALEPVASVSHPPTKEANGNRSKKRPHNRQGKIRYQPKRNENAPEDLAFHSSILTRGIAAPRSDMERISRRNTSQERRCRGFRILLLFCNGNGNQKDKT